MEEETVSFSTSFNFTSSHGFAQVADGRNPSETLANSVDDFEFTFNIPPKSDLTVDEIFPIFDRGLLIRNDHDVEERDPPSSPSSDSDANNELESVPEGTYSCVWRREVLEKPTSRFKKSDSTAGTSSLESKQWKLSDFLHGRSYSEGKEDSLFVFVAPNYNYGEEKDDKVAGKAKATEKVSLLPSAHEVLYARKGGEKRKSYLPYRQDLFVGFFANVNRIWKDLPNCLQRKKIKKNSILTFQKLASF